MYLFSVFYITETRRSISAWSMSIKQQGLPHRQHTWPELRRVGWHGRKAPRAGPATWRHWAVSGCGQAWWRRHVAIGSEGVRRQWQWSMPAKGPSEIQKNLKFQGVRPGRWFCSCAKFREEMASVVFLAKKIQSNSVFIQSEILTYPLRIPRMSFLYRTSHRSRMIDQVWYPKVSDFFFHDIFYITVHIGFTGKQELQCTVKILLNKHKSFRIQMGMRFQ